MLGEKDFLLFRTYFSYKNIVLLHKCNNNYMGIYVYLLMNCFESLRHANS